MSRSLHENLGLSHAETARLEALMNLCIECALIDVDCEDMATVGIGLMDAGELLYSARRAIPSPTRCAQHPRRTCVLAESR
jgi:hypothetical protein